MKDNKTIRGMHLLLMCISLLVGCNPATPAPTATNLPPTQTPIPPTSTLPPSATPLPSPTPIPALSPGTYKMTLTAQEAGRFSPLDLSGEWLVTLHPNDNSRGTIVVSVNGSITQFGTGTYTLNTDIHQLTIVLQICGPSNVGLYHWTFDGTTLILKSIADQCADRVFLMEVHPWTRQP